jgi:hypothetical protein
MLRLDLNTRSHDSSIHGALRLAGLDADYPGGPRATVCDTSRATKGGYGRNLGSSQRPY